MPMTAKADCWRESSATCGAEVSSSTGRLKRTVRLSTDGQAEQRAFASHSPRSPDLRTPVSLPGISIRQGFENGSSPGHDADGQQNRPEVIERGVPERANHGQCRQEGPGDTDRGLDDARSFSEQRVKRQPHGQRRRAHRGHASGREGELAVVAPLDQRLGDVLAYEERRCRQSPRRRRRGEGPVGRCRSRSQSARATPIAGPASSSERFAQVRGRRRSPEPCESGILESVRAVAMGYAKSQKRERTQASHRDHGEPERWQGAEGVRRYAMS